MKGKTLIGAAVGTIGAAAVGNRLLSRRVTSLGPPLERETGSYRWRGMNIAYTEGGDPEDPDMVLVHAPGIIGTSREFNRVFERLAGSYHVLAPDLPGFGRSDRPPLTYSSTLYETFLEDFVRDLLQDPVAIASGLSGAYVVAAARNVDLERSFLICPTTTIDVRAPTQTGRILRIPVLGKTSFNGMVSQAGILRHVENRWVFDTDRLGEHDITYFWQTAHQPGARYAPSSCYAGYCDSQLDLDHALQQFGGEATIIWGRETTTPSLGDGRTLAQGANTKLVVVDQSRAMPHFEQPGAFFDILEEHVQAFE